MFVEESRNGKEWERFLEATSGGTFYHSMNWRNVIERSFSLPTIYLQVRDENGRLVGILPTCMLVVNHLRILNSLPYSDFGGPVIEEKSVQKASVSLRKFIEEFSTEEGISLVKICFMKDGSNRSFKTARCFVNDQKGVVQLDIRAKPSAFIWNKILRKRHRKKIRRFERDGFQVREAITKSDLKSFLKLYYLNMKRISAIGYPYTFFETMWDLLHPKNFHILLVEKNDVVGGLAFFKYAKTVYLTYLGMEEVLLSSRYSVTPLLYWEAIKWAEENGFQYVCLGSTAANPKGTQERAIYSQKMVFGSSFLRQERLFIPFGFWPYTLFLLGSKFGDAYKARKDTFPSKLQRIIRNKLINIF